MAIIVTGADQDLDMFDLLAYGSLADLFDGATVVTHTASTFHIRNDLTDEDLTITGSFTYSSGSNTPSSGTITGIVYEVGHSMVFTASDASLSVSHFNDYVVADDMLGLSGKSCRAMTISTAVTITTIS
ncbi:hypothetical protein LZ016_06270 [Sphingomonas sp. SM33]|uniref:Uncharacterized protein n=1 Tax=Sphingomonas telluris TaxID=2907998 RepID=A0ABS9VL57_9SPHN|nr:hypothetical protein [Sphingomonas telluris]MCH8615704.1 hypothetical protein [Sphingomonas telluris]